jgi:hypothetical protein
MLSHDNRGGEGVEARGQQASGLGSGLAGTPRGVTRGAGEVKRQGSAFLFAFGWFGAPLILVVLLKLLLA